MHSYCSTRLKILMNFTHRSIYSRVITPGASGKRGCLGPKAYMDDLEKKVFFFRYQKPNSDISVLQPMVYTV